MYLASQLRSVSNETNLVPSYVPVLLSSSSQHKAIGLLDMSVVVFPCT